MKAIRLLCIFAMAFIMMSCKSNQKKAEELIRQDLFESLYDFESYEPISTTILKQVTMPPIMDPSYMELIFSVGSLMKTWKIHNEAAKAAQDQMEIWGEPTEYSSSYSDKKYYKYRKEFLDEYNLSIEDLSNAIETGIELEQQLQKIDTTHIVGYEVHHKFRAKTKGGQQTLGNFRYIIDNKFKKIIRKEDLDDEFYQELNDVIDDAKFKRYTKMKEALKDIIQKKEETK